MYNTAAVGVRGLELTEEEKRQYAQEREKLMTRLPVFMGLQILAGLGLIGVAITGVVFYHDTTFNVPFFIGGFIAGPAIHICALCSYALIRLGRDFSKQKAQNQGCCILLALAFGIGMTFIGAIVGIPLAATSPALTKDSCTFESFECTEDPNEDLNQKLAFTMIGLYVLALIMAIACIVLLSFAPNAFRTTRKLYQIHPRLQQQSLQQQMMFRPQHQPQPMSTGYGGNLFSTNYISVTGMR